MSLLNIQLDADNELGGTFTQLERQNLPFAIVQACNATAVGVRDEWKRQAERVFDRPKPLTVNAILYTKATKQRLYADVFIRDEALAGTPPAKYLLAEVEGGNRRRKGFESLLARAGALPGSMVTVPGAGADLDSYGNMKAAQISKILSQMGARRDEKQNETEGSRDRRRKRAAKRGDRGGEFFVIKRKRGRLGSGIYERLHAGFGSGVRSVLRFVRKANYKPRYDIYAFAERTWDKLMPFHFKRELDKAVQTSKFRGRE